ncbi:AH receptor-interacting protein-like [Sycon ciliatum]|uniref:AH receptor-interacting protein-like n=1 Tax=Sycon ciliatum TaxID=27933 RepID=UPI0020AB901C
MEVTMPNGGSGLDAEKLAAAFAAAMEQCGMSGDGDLVEDEKSKKKKKAKIREVKEDGNDVSEDEDEEGSDEEGSDEDDSPWEQVRRGIQKRLITFSPLEAPDFCFGCYALVHFRSTILEKGGKETTLDDTHTLKGGPLEYLVHAEQIFPVLMEVLQEMRVQEVAHFIVDADRLDGYSKLMTWWRQKCKQRRPDVSSGAERSAAIVSDDDDKENADLAAFSRSGLPLRLEVELCALDPPCDVERDMHLVETPEQKAALVPRLRQRGVDLYRMHRLDMAYDRFCTAVSLAQELLEFETPTGEHFRRYQTDLLLPLALNCSQCALNRGEFERAVTWCTLALGVEPDNVKALFRRARAYLGAWEPDLARRDYQLAQQLDPSLERLVEKELARLAEQEIEASRQTAEMLTQFSQTGTLELPADQRLQIEQALGVAGADAV